MRFLEVLKTIRNKFIRKNPQTQPEGTQTVSEEMETPEKEASEEAAEIEKRKKEERDKLIRRYRAYAYHHKKRRIRKKYLKKLLEISVIDRLFYVMKRYK